MTPAATPSKPRRRRRRVAKPALAASAIAAGVALLTQGQWVAGAAVFLAGSLLGSPWSWRARR